MSTSSDLEDRLPDALRGLAAGLDAPASTWARQSVRQRADVIHHRRRTRAALAGAITLVVVVVSGGVWLSADRNDVRTGPSEAPGPDQTIVLPPGAPNELPAITVHHDNLQVTQIQEIPDRGSLENGADPEGDDGPGTSGLSSARREVLHEAIDGSPMWADVVISFGGEDEFTALVDDRTYGDIASEDLVVLGRPAVLVGADTGEARLLWRHNETTIVEIELAAPERSTIDQMITGITELNDAEWAALKGAVDQKPSPGG
jgi:hypothetical protein